LGFILKKKESIAMKKILYIDMDGVLVNFQSAFPHISADVLTKYEDRLDEVPGIFAFMTPMEGAVDAFNELALTFDTYILSTSPWENPSAWSDKLAWVKRYLGANAYKRLIISHHKDLNRGDFLVDDREKNGAGQFSGELILFGSDLFPNWASVTQYLRQRAT
jgi:5'-nucleotidase